MTSLNQYQAALNGVTIGRDTYYPGVGGTRGAVGSPPINQHDLRLEMRHGGAAGIDRYGTRTIKVPVQIAATSEAHFDTLLGSLKDAWSPSDTDQELELRLGGTQLSYFGRPRGVDDSQLGGKALINSTGLVVCEFAATDPFGYGATVTVPADTSTPVTLPNAGNAPTSRVTLTIVGSGGTPALVNTSDNAGDLTFTHTVSSTLTVDLRAMTVRDGSTSRESWLSIGSLWFELQPGDNTVTFTGCTSVAASIRPAYY